MKIRTGFVSNSSSSSFIIAFKGNKKELKVRLDGVFKLPEDYPLKQLVGDISKTIIKGLEEGYQDGIATMEDFLYYKNDIGNDVSDFSSVEKKMMDVVTKGFTIYPGEFSDDNGDIEAILCENDINYSSDDLIIIHEGGY